MRRNSPWSREGIVYTKAHRHADGFLSGHHKFTARAFVCTKSKYISREMNDRNIQIPQVCERTRKEHSSLSGLKWTDDPFLFSPGLSSVELSPAGRRKPGSFTPVFVESCQQPSSSCAEVE